MSTGLTAALSFDELVFMPDGYTIEIDDTVTPAEFVLRVKRGEDRIEIARVFNPPNIRFGEIRDLFPEDLLAMHLLVQAIRVASLPVEASSAPDKEPGELVGIMARADEYSAWLGYSSNTSLGHVARDRRDLLTYLIRETVKTSRLESAIKEYLSAYKEAGGDTGGTVRHSPRLASAYHGMATAVALKVGDKDLTIPDGQWNPRHTHRSVCWHCQDDLMDTGPSVCETCPPFEECDDPECQAPGCKRIAPVPEGIDPEFRSALVSAPKVPDGYRLERLDGRWRLYIDGCTESDPQQLLAQDGDGICVEDGYADHQVPTEAVAALLFAIKYDAHPGYRKAGCRPAP